jgi:coproporphyrinogen III oxidase
MHKFMSNITDVIVAGISLVMKGKNPAVPHAQTKFAILKSKEAQDEILKFEEIEKKLRGISV